MSKLLVLEEFKKKETNQKLLATYKDNLLSTDESHRVREKKLHTKHLSMCHQVLTVTLERERKRSLYNKYSSKSSRQKNS